MSTEIIVGAAVGAVALVLLALVGVLCYRRKPAPERKPDNQASVGERKAFGVLPTVSRK